MVGSSLSSSNRNRKIVVFVIRKLKIHSFDMFLSFWAHKRFLQYVAMCAGSLAAMTSGINVGWSSPYLPYLLNDTISHIPTTSVEGSWCAVMPLVGAPLGAFIGAMILDRTGRKNFVLSLAPIAVASFVTMAYARTILTIIILRFIIGSTEGALYTALPIYYGEIADPKIRGFISSSITVAAIIGTIFINVIGPITTIWASSLICCAIPVVHFFTFIWMPESPYYLIKRGDLDTARISLVMLRGSEDVDVELKSIASAVKRQESNAKSGILELVTVASNRKGLMIYSILSFTNKFTGKMPVIFYTTTIFAAAGGSVDPTLSVIIFSVVGLVATILAVAVIDRFGRRPLMLFSALGCSLALLCSASYFTIQSFYPEFLPFLEWLPLTSLVSYNVIFSLGISFGPVLYLSELFPTSIKAKALFVSDFLNVIMGVAASKFFHVSSNVFGMYLPFWTFAICGIVGTFLIFFNVPETKGKTLEQIQLELIGYEVQDDDKA